MFDLFFSVCGVDDVLIMAALSAAAAGASAYGQQQSENAANRRMSEELARQQDYQKKASKTFEDSLAGSTPEKAQQVMDAGTASRMADYAKQQSVPLSPSGQQPVGGESSRLVSAPAAQAQDRLSNVSRARHAGYTEWDLQQAIKDMQAEQQLGIWNNFSRGSSNILPMELQAAAHAGDSAKGIGAGLGMASSLYGGFSSLGSMSGSGTINAGQGATSSPFMSMLGTGGQGLYGGYGWQPNSFNNYFQAYGGKP